MHIANIESFKAWLVTSIRPICDADPYPLSKYVLALIKKDKDEKELKSICNDQLDVFFQENTLEFVEKLFQVLKDESYLKVTAPVPAPATAAPASATQVPPSAVSAASNQQQQQQQNLQSSVQTPQSAVKRKATTSAESDSSASAGNDKQQQQQQPPDSKISRVAVKQQPSEQKRPPPAQQSVRQSPPPPPPPPPSVPKDLRSTINSRAAATSSATTRHHQHHQQQQQLQQPHHHPAQGPMSSMASTGFQQGPLPFLPPPLPPPPPQQMVPQPPLTHHHPLPTASSAAVVGSGPGFYPHSMPMMLPPPPPQTHGPMTSQSMPPPPPQQQQQRLRCRDFDEKGFCMLGAACPYDHGAHPVIVAPSDPNYGKYFPGMMPPNSQPPQPHQMMPGQAFSTAVMVTAPSQPISAQSAMMSQQQQQRRQLQHPRPHQHQQPDEAGPLPQRIVQPPPQSAVVTVVASGESSAGNNNGSNRMFQQQQQQHQQQQQQSQSCTLELRKVPASLNNADTLLEHFCRFGTVVDVDIGGAGSADSARVTFATVAAASAAYRSPEAVLNNRFIRMFLPGGGGGGGAGPRQSARERLGGKQQQNAQRRQSNSRRTSTGDGDSGDTSSDAGADSAAPGPPSRSALTWTPHSAETAAKAAEAAANAAAERRQESAKILQAQKVALERAKAHRELRAKQIRMLKDCKESLAKLGTLFAKAKDSDSRHSIAETMKPINAQIRDLESSLGVVSTGNANLRDLQKELLDLELEVFQKEGLESVAEQKKRLAEVRKLLAARLPQKPAAMMMPASTASSTSTALSGSTGAAGGPAGGGAAGGGGGAGGMPNFAQTRLDKRSKSLRIQGQPADKVDDLLRTLASQAGAKAQRHHIISGAGESGAQQQLLVDFATRAEAEAALAKLKSLADERPGGASLKAEWSQRTAAAAAADAAPPTAATATAAE